MEDGGDLQLALLFEGRRNIFLLLETFSCFILFYFILFYFILFFSLELLTSAMIDMHVF